LPFTSVGHAKLQQPVDHPTYAILLPLNNIIKQRFTYYLRFNKMFNRILSDEYVFANIEIFLYASTLPSHFDIYGKISMEYIYTKARANHVMQTNFFY